MDDSIANTLISEIHARTTLQVYGDDALEEGSECHHCQLLRVEDVSIAYHPGKLIRFLVDLEVVCLSEVTQFVVVDTNVYIIHFTCRDQHFDTDWQAAERLLDFFKVVSPLDVTSGNHSGSLRHAQASPAQ